MLSRLPAFGYYLRTPAVDKVLSEPRHNRLNKAAEQREVMVPTVSPSAPLSASHPALLNKTKNDQESDQCRYVQGTPE